MATFNRPPSDTTPKTFFTSFLPSEYARLRGEGIPAPPDVCVAIHLEGDGGGTWALTLAGGELTVSEDSPDKADIAIKQSVADWRTFTLEVPGEGDQVALPEGVSLESLLVNPAIKQTLDTTNGTLRIQITEFEGRTLAADITFHGAAEPHATISIDAETAAAIRDGSLPAPQAFFAGKIVIEGDSAFAMQVAMAAMTPQG